MFVIALTGAIESTTVVTLYPTMFCPQEKRPHMNMRTATLVFTAAMAATMLMGGCNKPPEETATMPAGSATSGNVSDINVTMHVKSALQQSETLKGVDINVVTLKGDVRLIGILDSQAQIDEAVRVARVSEGAHSIHNELTIRK
jgi:hyperosmotically inducible periplasmic protein